MIIEINKKVNDRINILKALSNDKSWALKLTNFLLSIYKVLIRSVMDYANVITAACNEKMVKDLEVLQNDALRVIYKKSILGPYFRSNFIGMGRNIIGQKKDTKNS